MILDIALTIAFLIFTMRVIVFSYGSFLERRKNKSILNDIELPFVSVVVAARNEENNIEDCIKSITASNYPINKYELIVVNDRSTDKTSEILNELSSEYPNLKVISVSGETTNKNLNGKPGALQRGIDSAIGSIILMTDADCTVSKKWMRSMAGIYSDESIGLVAAYTGIKIKTLFDKIQAVEWTYLHTIAIAGIALKMPLSCYGNNMSVRKSDFDKIGGYKGIDFSVTEDLALLHAMVKSGKKIRYLTHTDSEITTLPCPTFRDYLVQHHRWAIGALYLGWKAFAFVLTSLAVWFGIIISIIFHEYMWLTAFISARIIGDIILLLPTVFRLKKKELLNYALISIIFFLLMELIAPFFLLKRDVNWKNQTFHV